MKFWKTTKKMEVLTADQLKQVVGGDGSATTGGTILPGGSTTTGDTLAGKYGHTIKMGGDTTK